MGHIIEISAWAISMQLLSTINELYLTVAVIGQSFYALIAFSMEGLQKSVTATSSNYIGAKKYSLIIKSQRSAFIFAAYFAIPFGILLLVYPDLLIKQFLFRN